MIHTSYYAGYRGNQGVSISRYPPRWFNGRWYPGLAPTKELLRGYKDGTITKSTFRKEFHKQLSELDPQEVYDQLDGKVLLCFETPDKFCHRHMVASWLRHAGFPCRELKRKK